MPRILRAVALLLIPVALAGLPIPNQSVAAPRPEDKAPPPAKDAPKAKAAPKDKETPKPLEPPTLTEGFVRFRVQEIDTHIKVGYSVCVADVNGDGKPDIVVADVDRVVWYENPTWQKHTLVENRIKVKEGGKETEKFLVEMDNVSIAPAVIDGKVNFVLAAGWTSRFEGREPGVLKWLHPGKTPGEPWDIIPIPCTEPQIHRVRVVDLYGDGKPCVVVAPLMGRGSTRAGNWMDGQPVKIMAYKIPLDPVKGPWTAEVINDTLHVVHGFCPMPSPRRRGGFDLLVASYEGVTLIARDDSGKWLPVRLVEGDQRTPLGVRGCSEVKFGTLKATRFLTTIEPWHGNQVVIYSSGSDPTKLGNRQIIDNHLRSGHALLCADLDGDGTDEIIVGVRDDPTRGDSFPEKRGVRIYKSLDSVGKKWDQIRLDEGGVAVEDLAVADLNGDGRPDIIAVGRQTGNVKIYWNVK